MPPQRLGQHFLTRPGFLERLAEAACPQRDPLVIEIGPGRGALTRYLLERAERVVAIEVDKKLAQGLRAELAEEAARRLKPALQGEARATRGARATSTAADPKDACRAGELEVFEADVLATDLAQWGPAVVAGNLPYYITSPILEKLFAMGQLLKRAVVLVQLEVAQRLTANPGTRDYGYLTVEANLGTEPAILFRIRPGAFAPPPKVDSAAVLLTPRGTPLLPAREQARFLEFAGRCFRQKRKTLRNNLAPFYGPQAATWPEARLRAEQLALDNLIELYGRVSHRL